MDVRMRAVGLAATAVLVPLGAVACDPPAPWQACGSVGFAYQTDWGVWDIKQHATNCTAARQVAVAAKDVWGTSYSKSTPWGRFNCTGTEITQGLAGTHFHCTGPNGG